MMVLAGDFTVELARRVDGVTTELAGPFPSRWSLCVSRVWRAWTGPNWPLI
jgi:hypothetical protein